MHSSSIAQHFSFYGVKLFQLEKILLFFKNFLSKKNKKKPKWPLLQSHQGQTYKIYFMSFN